MLLESKLFKYWQALYLLRVFEKKDLEDQMFPLTKQKLTLGSKWFFYLFYSLIILLLVANDSIFNFLKFLKSKH